MTLSLMSVSVSMFSSRLVSDVVGCLSMSRSVGSCDCRLCGMDKVIVLGIGLAMFSLV